MAADGLHITAQRVVGRGPIHTGIRIDGNMSGVKISDCTVIGDTYPRRWLDWLTQHPSLRRRARVARWRAGRRYVH